MKKSFSPFISIVLLLFLLAKPKLSFSGARNGLILWADVVLPTLLPFMICTGVVVALGGVPLLVHPFYFLLDRIFHFSEAGSFVFLSGLLCGYPMGAKTAGEFVCWNMISKKEGQYLLAVSNHPSPMFLLGYVMAAWTGKDPIPLLLSVYLPLFPLSKAARAFYGFPGKTSYPVREKNPADSYENFSFDKSMMSSFEVMVKIGGYIMLFSIAAEFIKAISPFSPQVNAILLGITEMTTGIYQISQVIHGLPLKLALVGVTVFGGLSGIFQTKSVLDNQKNAGLSIRHYIIWKLIHVSLSCITLTLLSLVPLPGLALHL